MHFLQEQSCAYSDINCIATYGLEASGGVESRLSSSGVLLLVSGTGLKGSGLTSRWVRSKDWNMDMTSGEILDE